MTACSAFLKFYTFISMSERLCQWNPCVRKLVNLPSPSATYTGFLGFGFDPKIKDYRVVRFMTSEDRLDLANPQPEVEVYSLSTNEWRVIRTGLFRICTLCRPEPHAFVNGVIHWVAYRVTDDGFQPFVLVFNLANEVFHDIQLPPELLDTNENIGELLHSFSSVYGSVYVYENSIAYGYEKQYIFVTMGMVVVISFYGL